MTALSTLIGPLQRELAVPGTFADVFPDTSTKDLLGSLADGFGEAQLRGFFATMELTETPVMQEFETSEDLSAAGGATIVIFAAMRIIRAQLRSMNTVERYKAGPTEFELQHSANLLKGELDFLQKRLDDIVQEAKEESLRPLAAVYDSYSIRTQIQFGGFHGYEFGC